MHNVVYHAKGIHDFVVECKYLRRIFYAPVVARHDANVTHDDGSDKGVKRRRIDNVAAARTQLLGVLVFRPQNAARRDPSFEAGCTANFSRCTVGRNPTVHVAFASSPLAGSMLHLPPKRRWFP